MHPHNHVAADAAAYPGRAQRADAFPHVADLARRFAGTDRSSAEIIRLILFAGPCLTYLKADGSVDYQRTLSKPARLLLAVLVEHVHSDRWHRGDTYCWASNDYLAMRMDLADARQLRRLLSELETAGYIVRRYNGRNQRLEKQGIDLRPFGARLDDIEHACERMTEMHDLRRAERHAEFEDTSIYSTGEAVATTRLEDKNVRQESYKLQRVDPKGSVEKLPSDSELSKARATDQIKAAAMFDMIVVASPTFRRFLDPMDQRLPTPSAISAASVQILCTHFRALRPDVWPSAVQTLGIAAAAAVLAAAVDKVGVADRTRYLSSLLAKREIGTTILHSLRSMVKTAGSA